MNSEYAALATRMEQDARDLRRVAQGQTAPTAADANGLDLFLIGLREKLAVLEGHMAKCRPVKGDAHA